MKDKTEDKMRIKARMSSFPSERVINRLLHVIVINHAFIRKYIVKLSLGLRA